FRDILLGLRPQFQPQGYWEEKLFENYCWAFFQADRARAHEDYWQNQVSNNPDDDKSYSRYERMSKLRMMHERSAERARKEFGQVQQDRFATNQPNEILKEQGFRGERKRTFSAALPMWNIRKKEFRLCNASRIAGEEIFGYPDLRPPRYLNEKERSQFQ